MLLLLLTWKCLYAQWLSHVIFVALQTWKLALTSLHITSRRILNSFSLMYRSSFHRPLSRTQLEEALRMSVKASQCVLKRAKLWNENFTHHPEFFAAYLQCKLRRLIIFSWNTELGTVSPSAQGPGRLPSLAISKTYPALVDRYNELLRCSTACKIGLYS